MRIFLLTLLLICIAQGSGAKNYRINHPVEIDSLLVAWLIDRHIDPEARFILTTKEQTNQDKTVTSINTSDSPFRRGSSHTAFDVAVREFAIQNSCIEVLQHYNKILEITPWRKLEHSGAHNFENTITPLLPELPNGDDLQQSFSFIDRFCSNDPQDAGPE